MSCNPTNYSPLCQYRGSIKSLSKFPETGHLSRNPSNSEYLGSRPKLEHPSNLQARGPIFFIQNKFALQYSRLFSDIVLANLRGHSWLDNGSTLIIFEQTFINAYLNTVSQLRSSFERTPGGAFHYRLEVNQLKLEVTLDNPLVFYAFVFFLLATFVEIALLAVKVSKRSCDFLTRMSFISNITTQNLEYNLWCI